MSWLGAAGAFVLGWLVVRSTELRQTAPQKPTADSLQITAASGNTPPSSPQASRTEIQQGSALEGEVSKIVALANRTNEKDSRYVKELYEFASRTPLKEFPRVLDLLRKRGSKRTEQLRQELLAYWMEQNATAARSYISTLPEKERQRLFNADQPLNPVTDAWARADSQGLMDWLKNLPAREQQIYRESVRQSVAYALSYRDPAMAYSLLLDSSDGGKESRGIVESIIFNEWIRQDPEAAAAQALRQEAGIGRGVALSRVLAELVKKDQAGAIAWVRQIENPEVSREAAVALAQHLSNTDPERALTFVLEQGIADTPEAVNVRGRACAEWVRRDASRALEWAQRLEAGPARDALLTDMVSRVADTQPQRAAELFLSEAAQGSRLGNSASDIVQSFVNAGAVDAAASFLRNLPEAEQLRAINYAPLNLLDRLGPSGIIERGLQLPPGPLKDKWLQQSVENITMRKGSQEIQSVLQRLPAGPDRDLLTGRAVVELFRSKSDPNTAIALAQTLPNGREYLMQGVGEWLKGSDLTAARSWIQQTNLLTSEERQRLLRPTTPTNSVAPASGSNTSPAPAKTNIPRP